MVIPMKCSVRMPSTSIMEYRRGGCDTAHSAARTAPVAKVRRSKARWVRTMCSLPAAKIRLCSPTTWPPRRAANPMAPVLRAPVWPWRPLSMTSSRLHPAPLGHRAAHADGGAGWRVHLLPVVHLDDFRVVGVGRQGRAHAFGQCQHQVDPGGEIRRIDDRDPSRPRLPRRPRRRRTGRRCRGPRLCRRPPWSAPWPGRSAALVKSMTTSEAAASRVTSGNMLTSAGAIAEELGRLTPPATTASAVHASSISRRPIRPVTPIMPMPIATPPSRQVTRPSAVRVQYRREAPRLQSGWGPRRTAQPLAARITSDASRAAPASPSRRSARCRSSANRA